MNCPKCELELRINKSYTVVEGDKAVMIQEMICINPNCEKFEEVTEKIRHELN